MSENQVVPEICPICGDSNWDFDEETGERVGGLCRKQQAALDANAKSDRLHGPIGDAYARYDRDPRAHGPEDFEAFADAVEGLEPTTPGIVAQLTYELRTRLRRDEALQDYINKTENEMSDNALRIRSLRSALEVLGPSDKADAS